MKFLLTQSGTSSTYSNPQTTDVLLTPGTYSISCTGAKGGGSYNPGNPEKCTVTIKITSITTLRFIVGSTAGTTNKSGGSGYHTGSSASDSDLLYYGGGGSSAVLVNGKVLCEAKGGHGGYPTNISNYVTKEKAYDSSDKKYHVFGRTYVRGIYESRELGFASDTGAWLADAEWLTIGTSGSEKTGTNNHLRSIGHSSGVDPMGKTWTYHTSSCGKGHLDDDSNGSLDFDVKVTCGGLKEYSSYFAIGNRGTSSGYVDWEYVYSDGDDWNWNNINFETHNENSAASGGGSTYCNENVASGITLSNFNSYTNIDTTNGIIVISCVSLVYHTLTLINNETTATYQYYEGADLSYLAAPLNKASILFKHWYVSDSVYDMPFSVYSKQISFEMPGHNLTLESVFENNRKNSNIYKNIFDKIYLDLYTLEYKINSTKINTKEIIQSNHGFSQYDVLYVDNNGIYHKALAENSEKCYPVGIVSYVRNSNIFTLITDGMISYDLDYDYTDTCILYLSDKEAGKMSYYQDIENSVYAPVAIYTQYGLFIDIQQPTYGIRMVPYSEEESFERYSDDELDDIISLTVNGVK